MAVKKPTTASKKPKPSAKEPLRDEPKPKMPISSEWTFLSNHTHVLICLYRYEDMTLRDVANHVGITERAVQAIIADLESGGILERWKEGRNNRYRIYREKSLRHPLEKHKTIGDVLDILK